MFIAKKYSTFNEFIFFSEYSVLLMLPINVILYAFGTSLFTYNYIKCILSFCLMYTFLYYYMSALSDISWFHLFMHSLLHFMLLYLLV